MHPSFYGIRYLDPGSGSLLIQLLAAGVLGGLGILVKTFWRQIKGFLTGKKYVAPKPEFEEEEKTDEPQQ